MAFSSGTFTFTSNSFAPSPVLNTVISETAAASTWSELATALSTCVLKDGTQTLTANIPMGGFKLTGLAAGSAAGNSLRYEQRYTNPLTLGTAQATTSGTSIDFTSVPAGTKRVTINFVGVSTSGTSDLLIQIGDSGGIGATNYLGAGANLPSGGAISVTNYTTGFGILTASASAVVHGTLTLTLENAAAFTWVAAGTFSKSDAGVLMPTSGSKSLSAELDRVRLTTVNGSDTFDAGAVNITYE